MFSFFCDLRLTKPTGSASISDYTHDANISYLLRISFQLLFSGFDLGEKAFMCLLTFVQSLLQEQVNFFQQQSSHLSWTLT